MTEFDEVLRRHFIAIATDDFAAYEPLDVAAEVDVVRNWLCDDELGDRRFDHDGLAVRPTEDEVKTALTRRFTEADAVAVYVTGHGQTEKGAHFTVLADSDPARLGSTALETSRVVRWLRDHRDMRHVLLIIDLCQAGDVAGQLPAELKQAIPDDWVVWLTTAAGRDAKVGAFTGVLAEVLRELRTGNDRDATDLQEYLESHVLFGLLKKRLAEEHGQRLVPLADPYQVSCCLPNPKYDPSRHERVATAPERHDLAILRSDMETHWATRAPVSATATGAVFTGRRKLVTSLIGFLQGPPGALVVSGRVGSGKSAVLARVVTCSDSLFRQAHADLLRTVEPVPPEGIVDIAVLATGKSPEQIATQIATALGVSGSTMDELVNAITLRVVEPVSIVIDALDEASDPTGVVHGLLRRLPVSKLRLLVGVRSSGGATGAEDAELADVLTAALGAHRVAADGDDYWEPGDLVSYVAQILRGDDLTLAAAVEEAAGRSYLLAQLMAGQLAAHPGAGARELLSSNVTELLNRDLETSLPDAQERAVARLLLRACALAFGRGISWRDVWPAAASAIAEGRQIGDGDIERLLRHRLAGYLVRDVEDGVTVYRPFHDALRESLAGPEPAAAHRAIALQLRTLIGTDVPPPSYVRRHLASHAAAGGVLDESILTAETLPFLDAQRVSYELRLTEAPANSPLWTLLSAWRGVRHRWSWRNPRANAAALDMALVMADGRPPSRAPSGPTWTPLWAQWSWGGTVVAGNENHEIRLAVGEVQGRTVLAISDFDAVLLVDPVTGDQIGSPLRVQGPVRALAMAGGAVAAAVASGMLYLWDAATGRLLRVWRSLVANPRAIGLAEVRGDLVLAFPTRPDILDVWDAKRNIYMFRLNSRGRIGAVAVSPTALTVATENGLVMWWDFTSRKLGGVHNLLAGEINGCVYASTDGRPLLAVAFAENFASILDLITGRQVDRSMYHTDEVRAIACAEVEGWLLVATGSFDKTAAVWDPASGTRLSGVLPHPAEVNDVAFATVDGRLMLATACRDGNVRVWDPIRPSGARVAVEDRVGSIALRGGLVATGDERGDVRISRTDGTRTLDTFHLTSQDLTVKRLHEPSPVVRLGNGVIATYYSGVVQVRALVDVREVLREFRDLRGHGFIGGDRILIAIGPSHYSTKILDLESGDIVGNTRRSIEHIPHRCWVPGGSALELDKIRLHDGSHVVLSTGLMATGVLDGRTVLAEWQDDEVRLWDVDTGNAFAEPIRTTGGHRAIALGTLDGIPVVITSHVATIRVWNVHTGREIAELPFGTQIETVAVQQEGDSLLVAVGGPGVAVTRLG